MEGIQVLKYCQWVSPKVSLKQYFKDYKEQLRVANGDRDYYLKVDPNDAIKEFFSAPESESYARSTSGVTSFKVMASSADCRTPLESQSSISEMKMNYPPEFAFTRIGSTNSDSPRSDNDIFPLEEMEKFADLLTVDGEFSQKEDSQIKKKGPNGRCTNWFTGSFMDGIIPEKAPENLSTLAAQTRELYKRETQKDYIRYRHRQLKYASTVRMVMKDDNVPETIPTDTNIPDSCLNEIICNVRIQRPYHKKTLQRKGASEYPKYSEEFLLLGSQCLTELKDSILCVNDHYCHQEMSENPDLNHINNFATIEDNFPSSFFYISGVFYVDKRNPVSSDISTKIRSWAKSVPNYDEVTVKDMKSCKFIDLNIHLGYPYLYKHLGNCEHIMTMTDVRLHHRNDVQDPTKYPLLRGNPVKMSIKCFACKLYLANWVVKDSSILPTPFAHFCDTCLKLMFYDDDDRKIGQFKLYPFMDEIAAKKRKIEKMKRKKETSFKQIIIDGWKPDGSSRFKFV